MVTTFSTEKLRLEPTGPYAKRFFNLTSAQQMLIVRAEVACEEAWRAVYSALQCRIIPSDVVEAREVHFSLAQARVVHLRRALVWQGLSA